MKSFSNAISDLNEAAQKKYPFTLDQIQSKYKQFNKKLFGGKLPDKLPIKFNTRKALPAIAGANVIKQGKRVAAIKDMWLEFSTAYEPDPLEFDQLLLHEMVHIYIYSFEYIDGSQKEHGPEFEKKRNEIEKRAGIMIPKVESDFKISKENAAGKEFYVLLKIDHVLNKTSLCTYTKKAFESSDMIDSINRWTEHYKNLEFKLGTSTSHYLVPYPTARGLKKLKFYEIKPDELSDVEASFKLKDRYGKLGK